MKRALISLAATLSLLIIVGYPAGAWYVGKQVEATLGDRYQSLHDSPFLSVSDRKFKGGIFSSEETLTLNVTLVPGAMPLRLAVTSRIKQLPLPGIFALETAAIDSDIAFADGTAPEVAEWTGGQNLAAIHTAYYLNGSGNVEVSIPAFNSARLSSDQATLSLRFAKDMAAYSMAGSAPRFAIINKVNGERIQFSGVQLTDDHKRFFAGPPSLYSGSDHIVIDQIEMSRAGTPALGFIKHMTVEAMATASGDNQFVDITEKFGLDSLKVLDKDYGPAQLDLSFAHLDAKSISDLSRANWQRPGRDPALVNKLVETMLSRNPEFRIDRFSFTQPEGETVVSALFKMKDIQPGDLSNPQAVMSKGYVSVEIKVPEKLLAQFGQGMYAAATQGGGLDKELERMLAEGYATREDGYIRTKFEFHDAMPWFNGKQYIRRAVATPPAPRSRRR